MPPPRGPRLSAVALLAAATLIAAMPRPAVARNVWATVPYTLKGGASPVSSGGVKGAGPDVGGQLLMDFELLEGGKPVGRVYGTCRGVSAQGVGAVRLLCTQHYQWDNGASVMVGHATVDHRPGSPLAGKVSIVGGIGRWQGAHGEDLGFSFDPKSGTGAGKIVLYCLDGKC